MSEAITQALRSLRDLEGIVGSFVLRKDGTLCGRDLPDFFDTQTLAEVAPRIERLYEAWRGMGSDETALDTATLVFAEHKLHLREMDSAYVAVLSGLQVNAHALKMALNMVCRRITGLIDVPPASTPAAT
ncbi:MAG TPA: hypothetical protein VHM19_10340 [Polyangiales bacterium]|nr:hypothetical protein [Polyangiales bacterium]